MTGVSNRQPPFTSETTTLKGESRRKSIISRKNIPAFWCGKNHRNDAGVTASPAYREHKVTFPLIKIYLLRKANLLLINKTQRPLQQPLHAVLIKHGIPLTMHQAGSRRQSVSWQYLKRPTASPVSQLPPCPASSLYFSSSHFEVLLQCPLQNKHSEKKKKLTCGYYLIF